MSKVTRDRRLHVLMTADAVGGVWQYALDLARGLRRHDVATTLAILGPSPRPEQVAEAAAVPDLTLLPLDLPLDWTAGTPAEVKAAGVALAALADEVEADLIHLNSAALAAGAPFSVPTVVGCHSCVATWWETVRGGPMPKDFLWRANLVQQGYRAADAIIAPTAAFADATRRTYNLREAPYVVHNGRSLSAAPTGRAPISGSFAFTAGRLWDEGKNLAVLDRAAARLNLPVVAAGPTEGPNRARIELQHLKTPGHLSEGEIARWLKRGPIFVSSARYEPFGLAVLEAAQAGCPLVLSDIRSFRELWEGAALFVAADDDRGFARTVEEIVGDASLRTRLGWAASERARGYSAEAMTAGTLKVYGSVLASPHPHAAPHERAIA